MQKIDIKLLKILQAIRDNESSDGCSDDLTVTSKKACNALRKYLNKYEVIKVTK